MAKVLVLGGVRSGKSRWAEEQLAGASSVRYLATAADRPADGDWATRIQAHRHRRPPTWTTVECGGDPALLSAELTAGEPGQALLVDDVGNWLTGAFDSVAAWDQPPQADAALDQLIAAVAACQSSSLLLVSPEVGWGVLPATRAGRVFADAQGLLNQRLAAACDEVVLVVAGLPTRLK